MQSWQGATWIAGIVFPLIAISGLAWWTAFGSARTESIAVDGSSGIATVETPDVHSLMIDPSNQEHIFFGSHAGLKESADGGYSWYDGTLRDTDAMSVIASPEGSSSLYVAGHDVLEKSPDNGKTWQPVTHDLPATDIHAFAQDPTNPLHLFAFVVGQGIFSSSDGGATWTLLPTQPSGESTVALATNGSVLYAVTETGIQETRDAGAVWALLPASPGGTLLSLAITMSQPDVIYVATDRGLMKTNDRGQTWVAVGPATTAVAAVAVAPGNPLRILFVTSNGVVYRSDDGGAVWF